MIFSSSPIYTFADPEGRAVSIMVWEADTGFEVRALADDNNGVCLPAGTSPLDALVLADEIVQGMHLQFVREKAVPASAGGVDYWEL